MDGLYLISASGRIGDEGSIVWMEIVVLSMKSAAALIAYTLAHMVSIRGSILILRVVGRAIDNIDVKSRPLLR